MFHMHSRDQHFSNSHVLICMPCQGIEQSENYEFVNQIALSDSIHLFLNDC